MPATVVYFTTYEQFKAFLGYRDDGPRSENWYKPVMAGSGARGKCVCIEVLGPSQSNAVMSSVVSLPYHTFTGQA